MRTWYFSEMAYHPAWEKGIARGSLRVNFPNEAVDPVEAGKLLNRYLDEFRLCDEVGIDIMVNEHHSTATCMTVSVPMALAVIARETKKSRLLTLGHPIATRPDPVRVAEEMAWLDCLSGGRLEMGLVKGAPDYEGVAKQVMRTDIYEEAMKEIGYQHGGLNNSPETLFDGHTFDPAGDLEAYAKSFAVNNAKG